MKSTYDLIWTKEAKLGLAEILSYLSYKFSEKGVKKFSAKLNSGLEILQSRPLAYAASRSTFGARRIVIGRFTSLIFAIEGDKIIVLSVHDNRKSPKKHQS